MELASMLAGERFSDHPESVSPVIGALLRSYNDAVSDTARQELYGYASSVVGSRASDRIEEARADRLVTWTIELEPRRWGRWLLKCRLWARTSVQQADVFAAIGVHSLMRTGNRDQAEVLALVDELLSIGAKDRDPAIAEVLSTRRPEGDPGEAPRIIRSG